MPLLKLSYITGLKSVVHRELAANRVFTIASEEDDSILLEYSPDAFAQTKALRSVARVYLVTREARYNPGFVSHHKSVLGEIIDVILAGDAKHFKTFKISCAGADTKEVKTLARYVVDTYSLTEQDEADLKIHIIKVGDEWEVGAQITPRPLSVREYKVEHMSGAMDPTIAYAVNTLAKLEKAKSYLNVFSGSGTLLIEAAQCYPKLAKLVGFDYDKKHLSLSIQNIKEAGLIKRVTVKEGNIFDKPDLGMFDAIVSDLPFGMAISKDEDLGELYKVFVRYCEGALERGGRLVVYTSEHEILEKALRQSNFTVVETLNLKFITSVNAYLKLKVFVCELKA